MHDQLSDYNVAWVTYSKTSSQNLSLVTYSNKKSYRSKIRKQNLLGMNNLVTVSYLQNDFKEIHYVD